MDRMNFSLHLGKIKYLRAGHAYFADAHAKNHWKKCRNATYEVERLCEVQVQ
jgi:hypothetical protein